MTRTSEFLGRLLAIRQLQRPSGGPLYSYKTTKEELEDLVCCLQKDVPELTNRNNIASQQVYAGLCLAFAETICRWENSRSVTWAEILASLELPKNWQASLQELLYPKLKSGLRWWGRPWIQTQHSHRYLTTLTLEGGLPRWILHESKGSLGRFLAALLRSSGSNTEARFEEYAVHIAPQYLPPTFQRPELIQLLAELAGAVACLRQDLKNGPLNGRPLDEVMPSWSLKLPIHFEGSEKPLRELIQPLLALQPTSTVSAGCYLELTLERSGSAASPWFMKRQLHIPPVLDFASVQGEPLKHPGLVKLHAATGTQQAVCQVSVRQRGDGNKSLQRQGASPVPVNDRQSLLGQWRLEVTVPGEQRRALPLHAADDLTGRTWIFNEPDPSGVARLIGIDRIRTTRRRVLVALPQEATPQVGAWTPGGSIRGHSSHRLFELDGPGSFQLGQEQFELALGESSDLDLRLDGKPSEFLAGRELAWLGAPRILFRTDPDAAFDKVPTSELHWWSESSGEVPWNSRRWGRGRLRWRQSGKLLCSVPATVLPPNFQAGRLPQGEGVEICCPELARLEPRSGSEAELRVEQIPDCFHVRASEHSTPLNSAHLKLIFKDGGLAELELPIVSKPGFYLEGRRMKSGEKISLYRLGRVEAIAPARGVDPHIRIQVPDLEDKDRFLLVKHLESSSDGLQRLNMGEFRQQFELLLGCQSTPEAQERPLDSRLTVELLNRPDRPSRIEVGYYDIDMRHEAQEDGSDETNDCFSPTPHDYDGDASLVAIESVRLIPTWKPAADPIELVPVASEGYHWPLGLESGWWLAALEAKDPTFSLRPVAYWQKPSTAGEQEDKSRFSFLESAARQPLEYLNSALDSEFDRILRESDFSGLEELLASIARLKELPAPTFWTHRRLFGHPAICAALLLHAPTPNEQNLVLQLLPKGVFLWELVSLNSWTRAVQSVFLDQDAESHSLDGNGIRTRVEEILDRASLANSSWHIVLAIVLETLNIPRSIWPRGCRDLPESKSQRAVMAGLLLERHYQEFRQRHAAGEEAGENAWPKRPCPEIHTEAIEHEVRSHAFRHDKSYHKTVLQAPSLAAWMFFNSNSAPTFEQRAWFVRMHGIDPVWFQGAFACAVLSVSASFSRS